MAGRISAGTEKALKAWKPGASWTTLARRYLINPSTLYRALIRAGLIQKQ